MSCAFKINFKSKKILIYAFSKNYSDFSFYVCNFFQKQNYIGVHKNV